MAQFGYPPTPPPPPDCDMSKILEFRKPSAKAKNKGKTLCLHDFHKWQLQTTTKFDVKLGKLVSVFRCERCGKQKNQLV